MKFRVLSLLSLAAALSLGSCNNTETRTDGTAGEAVSDLDQATEDGGVKADAVVIDNEAGPTVTADPDTMTAPMPAGEMAQ